MQVIGFSFPLGYELDTLRKNTTYLSIFDIE